jgi:hypothetical protein
VERNDGTALHVAGRRAAPPGEEGGDARAQAAGPRGSSPHLNRNDSVIAGAANRSWLLAMTSCSSRRRRPAKSSTPSHAPFYHLSTPTTLDDGPATNADFHHLATDHTRTATRALCHTSYGGNHSPIHEREGAIIDRVRIARALDRDRDRFMLALASLAVTAWTVQ